MNSSFTVYNSAKKLPYIWDKIAGDNIFIKRDFLIFLEEVNYCKQDYHINEEKNIIMVTYRLKLNLFTFSSKLKLEFNIRVLGIPLSISCAGFVCGDNNLESLSLYLKTFRLMLILNTDGKLPLPKACTLGTYTMELKGDFELFFTNLRSRHRRRLKRAIDKSNDLNITKLSKQNFQKEHYSLYEQVYERSEGRLEKLNIEYFQKMNAEIYEVRGANNELVAFFQIKQIEKELIFLFCGVDKANNRKYDTYLNMLLYIVRLAYEKQCSRLHLGQTTGYSKSRLGAKKDIRYMHLTSSFIPSAVCKMLLDMLGYKED
jgi:hypothetical protein